MIQDATNSSSEQAFRLLEAAYDLSLTEQEWFQSIAQLAEPLMGPVELIIAHEFRVNSNQEAEFWGWGLNEQEIQFLEVGQKLLSLKKGFFKELYSSQIEHGLLSESYGPEELAKDIQGFGFADLDLLFTIARTSDAEGLLIGAIVPEGRKIRASEKFIWSKLAPHLAGALSLRRAILSVDSSSIPRPGKAIGNLGQPTLLSSNVAPDRRLLEMLDDEELKTEPVARSFWNEIVSGNFSLISRCSEDGQSLLVGFRNPKGVSDPRKLNEQEIEVAVRAAVGTANKEIASLLGYKESTVATYLSSALRKLGLSSRLELPVLWRDATAPCRSFIVGGQELFFVRRRTQIVDSGVLTPSEHEIVLALRSGLSNREIAERRGVSVRTVANQLASIFKKLEVKSRSEVVSQFEDEMSIPPSR